MPSWRIALATSAVLGGISAIAAGGAGALSPVAAISVGLLIVYILTFKNTRLYVAICGLSLPFASSLIIQSPVIVIPLCDVFALTAILSWLVTRRVDRQHKGKSVSIIRAVAPALICFGPYCIFGLFNQVYSFPGSSMMTILQRIEIVVVWLLLGAVLVRTGSLKIFLGWFVSGAILLSIFWLSAAGQAAVLGVQKNASGGYISAGFAIVLLSNMKMRWRALLLALLSGGLVSTGSRGAILGLVVSCGLLIFFASQWKKVVPPLMFAMIAGFISISLLPGDVAARLLSQNEAGEFNIQIRGLFVSDALYQWRHSPWTGVGIGNYRQILPGLQQVQTYDPHNVFVLALVEGGYLLLAAFLIFVIGTLLWILVLPRTRMIVLAIVVQVSLLVHSSVDVYWVRGTPAIGWLLIGAVMAAACSGRQPVTPPQSETENDVILTN